MLTPQGSAYEGILPSLPTPFEADDALDLEGQRAVTRFAISSGAHGLVCFGLAGEVTKLTPAERMELAEVIVDEANRQVPVLIGVGAEARHTAIELARHAERIGADAIVVPPPFQGRLDSASLKSFFLAVGSATGLPVVLQDASAYAGPPLTPTLALELANALPVITAVKIEAGPEETARWVSAVSAEMAVLTGDAGTHLLGCLRVGARGNVPGVEFTDLLVEIYRQHREGSSEQARTLFHRLLPYLTFSLQGLDHYNACAKRVLVLRGIIRHGHMREPEEQLTQLGIEFVDDYVRAFDVIAQPYGAASASLETGPE